MELPCLLIRAFLGCVRDRILSAPSARTVTPSWGLHDPQASPGAASAWGSPLVTTVLTDRPAPTRPHTWRDPGQQAPKLPALGLSSICPSRLLWGLREAGLYADDGECEEVGSGTWRASPDAPLAV